MTDPKDNKDNKDNKNKLTLPDVIKENISAVRENTVEFKEGGLLMADETAAYKELDNLRDKFSEKDKLIDTDKEIKLSNITGFSKGQKRSLFWLFRKMSWSVLWAKTPLDIVLLAKSLDNVSQILISVLLPSKETLRNVIAERPMEPFGIPGLIDTTKMDKSFEELTKEQVYSSGVSTEFGNTLEKEPLRGRIAVSVGDICDYKDCRNLSLNDLPGWCRCWEHRPTASEVHDKVMNEIKDSKVHQTEKGESKSKESTKLINPKLKKRGN